MAVAPRALAPAAPSTSAEPGRLGGPATVWDAGPNAFAFPASVLDRMDRRAFAIGTAFFKENWVTAPASTDGRDGLGPLFVARSCSTCHTHDGRGRPQTDGEVESSGLIFRVGVVDGAGQRPHSVYGEQIQDRSILGVAPEARVRMETASIDGRFPDGALYTLEEPRYSLEVTEGGGAELARLSPRVATQLVGLGLLEAIAEESIRARADPEDRDGDGVSGRANIVFDRRTGEPALGRFGWKASQPTIEQQVASAFQQDLGITSSLFPREALTELQLGTLTYVSGGQPELDDRKLERISFYCRVLGVPAQRAADDPAVRRGAWLFTDVGCAACHVPEHETGDYLPVPAYSNVRIRPYTDLLLHDMGPSLADELGEGQAAPGEWRTPPLWGIGLFATVNGHTRYLHDGRARNLEEAILWHGGEAARSRAAYEQLPAAERAALVAFLNSL
jgi:CxxC motif-containing protein (DUF1111 family)